MEKEEDLVVGWINKNEKQQQEQGKAVGGWGMDIDKGLEEVVVVVDKELEETDDGGREHETKVRSHAAG